MISVITIEANRREHLEGVLWGLENNRSVGEWIVVHMAPYHRTLQSECFPIKQFSIDGTSDLPLAAARNRGAREATFDNLVFLDVDCIPAADQISSYRRMLNEFGGIVNGSVAYLPKLSVNERRDYEIMLEKGKRHDARIKLGDRRASYDQYSLFWSLNFAISHNNFSKLGGFDERYIGYGGEDTDFAWMARGRKLPLRFTTGALAFHQWHQSNELPIHHRHSIVHNANIFFAKWGKLIMEGWLQEFERLDYVTRQGSQWMVIK